MKLLSSFWGRLILAILSGAVFAVAFPLIGCRWLVFPGLIGLLVALYGQTGSRARMLGFFHGLTSYAIGLFWLLQIFGTLAVLLWAVLALFTALFAEMQSRAVAKGWRGGWLLTFTVLNWCGWEFIRAELFTLKFPWMTPGLALGPNALLPWIGVYGVSGIVILISAALVIRMKTPALAGTIVILIALFISSRISSPSTDDPNAIRVAGVQMEEVSFDHYLAATRQLPADIQHVVWPEYAVPYDIRKNERDWQMLLDLCRERRITLTFGTQSVGDGGTWRNIALTMDANGVLGEHNKIHTVHLFDDGIAGTTAASIRTVNGKIGTPICFDNDYEGVVRRMTAAGAEYFAVPVMDAKKWTAAQHEQHAELFRIRAGENARWMFVCATSGVSQIIDPHGGIHSRLGAMEQGIIVGMVGRETKLTFYNRIGWLVPWCLFTAAAGAWIWITFHRKERSPAA